MVKVLRENFAAEDKYVPYKGGYKKSSNGEYAKYRANNSMKEKITGSEPDLIGKYYINVSGYEVKDRTICYYKLKKVVVRSGWHYDTLVYGDEENLKRFANKLGISAEISLY